MKNGWIERLTRLKIALWACGIFIICLLMLYSTIWIQDPFWIHFIETIAIGLLPVATFLLIYEYDTRASYQQLVREEFQKALFGLTAICGESQKYGLISLSDERPKRFLDDFFLTAAPNTTLKVLGVALTDFIDVRHQDEIMAAIKNNCNVKLLYLNPDSNSAEVHSVNEGRPSGDVANDIRGRETTWPSILKMIGVKILAKSPLQVKKYDCLPQYFMLISSESVCVGFYLHGRRGNKCPHFIFRKDSPMGRSFIAHFEKLWGAAR